MAKRIALIGAALLVTVASGCGGDKETASSTSATTLTESTTTSADSTTTVVKTPTSTTAVATTVETTTTTAAPATTTAVPTTTATPVTTVTPEVEGVTGLVWASAVDDSRINTTEGRPTFEVGAVKGSVEMILNVAPETATAGGIRSECLAALEYYEIEYPDATHCTKVQVTFDVSDDIDSGESAQVAVDSLVTAEGTQIDALAFRDAYGGTIDNYIVGWIPASAPGGTVRLEVIEPDAFETIVIEIPDQLPPVNFSS